MGRGSSGLRYQAVGLWSVRGDGARPRGTPRQCGETGEMAVGLIEDAEAQCVHFLRGC
jgi:hypothetical protein